MGLIDALLLDPAPFHIWVSIRSDGQLGSGLVTDPYDGSKVGSSYRFDVVMAKFNSSSNIVVHLGPGVFPTKGYGGSSPAWQARPGMVIQGSGLGITTIQLNIASLETDKQYFAIGHDLTVAVDGFQVMDLTIDCNAAQLGATTSACGAVRVMGNHARISRIEAINWANKNTSKPAYVLSMITGVPDIGGALAEMVNMGMEDCYVQTPGSGSANTIINLLNFGYQEGLTASSKETQAKGGFIRNCFVDGGVTSPDPSPTSGRMYVRAITMGWCRGGVVEGNQLYNVDVGGPYGGGATYQTQFTVRDIIVRNNFYKNVARGPYFNLFREGSNLFSGGMSPSIAITAGNIGTVTGLTSVLGLSTLLEGDRIRLVTSTGAHDGMYQVRSISIVGGGNSSFVVTTAASTPTPVNVTEVHKLKSVTRAIIEGNVIELAPSASLAAIVAIEVGDNGGAKVPDYAHGEAILRNNKVRYVDGASGGYLGKATKTDGAKTLLVTNNVVFSDQVDPLQNSRCGSVMYSNNRSPATKLVQGYNPDTKLHYGELETDVDDMFLLSILNGD